MRRFKIGLLFVLLLPAVLVQAQDKSCDVNINPVIELLEEAQAKASDNDAREARKLLRDAAAEIEALAAGCKGDIDVSEQKTIQLQSELASGELTFSYPAGWVTGEEQPEEFPNILVASNTSALGKPLDNSTPPPFIPGEALIAIGIANAEALNVEDDLGKSPAPADIIQTLITAVEDTLGKASEPTIRTLNDHPAAWVTLTGSPDFSMLIMLVDMKQKAGDGYEQYVLLFAIAAPGELAELEPAVEAMAESLRLKLN